MNTKFCINARQIFFRKVTSKCPATSRLIQNSKYRPDLFDSQQQRKSFLKPFHPSAFLLRNSFHMYCIPTLSSLYLSSSEEPVKNGIQTTCGEKKSNCREYCFNANKTQSFYKRH
ncbi:hypothetical protein CDAR_47311 [Caerostris darwini]|uniref:Uncharacterized protein n=1 Tax=Caerostris darwini TaxID=1538125 RepID=A0AAV4T840_9ARAC|nr:hypothetical protein CDAR_47311 [Caerostris darwini]